MQPPIWCCLKLIFTNPINLKLPLQALTLFSISLLLYVTPMDLRFLSFFLFSDFFCYCLLLYKMLIYGKKTVWEHDWSISYSDEDDSQILRGIGNGEAVDLHGLHRVDVADERWREWFQGVLWWKLLDPS